MRFIINKGEKRHERVENETISGLLFSIVTDIVAPSFDDLANTFVTIYRELDGKRNHNVTPDRFTLRELYDYMFANNSDNGVATFETKQIIGSDSVNMLPFFFGSAMNLKAGESLFVEIENRGSAVTPAGTWTIECETIPCVGVETFNPSVERIQLDDSRSYIEEKLGNFIHEVVIPQGISDLLDLEIISDKLNQSFSSRVLATQIFRQATIDDTGDMTLPFYLVQSEAPLHNVVLKMRFASAAARDLYVQRRHVSVKMLNNLQTKVAEHVKEQIADVKKLDAGVGKMTGCGCN